MKRNSQGLDKEIEPDNKRRKISINQPQINDTENNPVATRWKKADLKSKLSVFGWIRSVETKIYGGNCELPDVLKQYCISYYFNRDFFTDHGKKIIVDKLRELAGSISDINRRNTIYGNELIDLESIEYYVKHCWIWKFQISQTNCNTPGFWIGINDSNKKILNDAVDNEGLGPNIGYYLSNNGSGITCPECLSESIAWKKDATIEMQIVACKARSVPLMGDMTFKIHSGGITDTLQFKIQPLRYYLAVVISERGQRIKLLNYDHIIEQDCDSFTAFHTQIA